MGKRMIQNSQAFMKWAPVRSLLARAAGGVLPDLTSSRARPGREGSFLAWELQPALLLRCNA